MQQFEMLRTNCGLARYDRDSQLPRSIASCCINRGGAKGNRTPDPHTVSVKTPVLQRVTPSTVYRIMPACNPSTDCASSAPVTRSPANLPQTQRSPDFIGSLNYAVTQSPLACSSDRWRLR